MDENPKINGQYIGLSGHDRPNNHKHLGFLNYRDLSFILYFIIFSFSKSKFYPQIDFSDKIATSSFCQKNRKIEFSCQNRKIEFFTKETQNWVFPPKYLNQVFWQDRKIEFSTKIECFGQNHKPNFSLKPWKQIFPQNLIFPIKTAKQVFRLKSRNLVFPPNSQKKIWCFETTLVANFYCMRFSYMVLQWSPWQ